MEAKLPLLEVFFVYVQGIIHTKIAKVEVWCFHLEGGILWKTGLIKKPKMLLKS